MGQTSSKSHTNHQIQQLKQLYEPTSRLPSLPGQPLCLQYSPPISQPPAHLRTHPFLELYTFELNSNQKQVLQDTRLYQLRKNHLPWIVKVVCFDVERKDCQCSFFACKYTVCTERVDFRLHSFKTSGKGFADLNTSKKYMQSFSLEQGVYVMMNALQGYQILTQQFRVNCPNARSIGITRQGQIKVWIHENWSLNQQNPIAIQDREIIQEVIRLVLQRTKGNLAKMLGIEAGYSNFSFPQIQTILAQFVIPFNHGKNSLKERLGEASLGLLDDSVSKPRKYSLKKEKHDQTPKAATPHTPHKSKHTYQTTERRFYSHEIKKQKIDYSIIHTQNHSAKKETTTHLHSQPKKEFKFVYPQTQPPTYYPATVRANSSQVIQFNVPSAYDVNPKIIFRSEPVINNYNNMEQKNNSLPAFERAMSRKISDKAKTLTIATTLHSIQPSKVQERALSSKLNMVTDTSYHYKKNILEISQSQKTNILGSFDDPKRVKRDLNAPIWKQKSQKTERDNKVVPKTVSFVTPSSILAQGQILVTQQRSEHNTPAKVQSINSITQQFRQLLQSDNKIQSQLDISQQQIFDIALLSLEKSQKQLKKPEAEQLLYQKSESDIVRPSMTKCYSIKQVDEELSYELEGNNM